MLFSFQRTGSNRALFDRQSLSNPFCVDLFVSNNRVQYLVSIPYHTMVIRFIWKEKKHNRTDIWKLPLLHVAMCGLAQRIQHGQNRLLAFVTIVTTILS